MLNTNISVLISSKCTLNCEYCSVGMPYHAERRHIALNRVIDQIEKTIALYVQAGIAVTHLDLLGGEPLLHPELIQIIDGIYKYKDTFHELRILTNGTVMPTAELLQAIKKKSAEMPFLMIISDYGSLSPKTDEICGMLKEFGLKYRIDHYNGEEQYFDGWVSYGQDGMVSGTAKERYQECAFYQSGTVEVFDGLLFPCVRALALHTTGRVILRKDEYIDIYEPQEKNVEKLSGFINREAPYAVCGNCSGLCQSAIRYPAAKQMKGERDKHDDL